MSDIEQKIDDNDKMTLTLDDGSEIVCDVIAIFNAGENDYVALLPEDAGVEDDIFMYRFIMKDEENFDDISLENIESDEEFDLAAEAFEAYMEQMEIIDEDDAE